MKLFIAVAVAALAVLYAPFAFAAEINIGQALNGSIQEIINATLTAAIAALVGWVLVIVKNKFNIDIEARHREALTAFLQRQASGLVAMGAVKLEGVKVEVKNEALAAAANTALAAIPGALAFFGLTPAKIQGMIVDLLPKQPAVAQAQAVAIDVANPATPSPAA
jgi:ATP-dependent protease Clp ATPase subunit